jgi:hypothetical protein
VNWHFLIALLISLPAYAAEPGRICINNQADFPIHWRAISPDGASVHTKRNVQAKSGWRCVRVKHSARGSYQIRVTPAQGEKPASSCYFSLGANEWAQVDGSDELKCSTGREGGKGAAAKYAKVFEAEPVYLQGIATLINPVDGGTVRLRDRAGKLLGQATTFENGGFAVRVKEPSESGYVVEVTGEGIPGKLEASLPADFDFESKIAHVHLVSSFVSELLVREGQSQVEEEARARAYLGIPNHADLGFDVSRSGQRVFGSRAFLAEAQEMHGIENLTRVLADDLAKGGSAGGRFPPNRVLRGAGAAVAEQLAVWAATEIGKKALSSLLDKAGWKTEAQKAEDQMNLVINQLAAIQQKLDQMEKNIQASEYNQRSTEMWRKLNLSRDIFEQLTANQKAYASLNSKKGTERDQTAIDANRLYFGILKNRLMTELPSVQFEVTPMLTGGELVGESGPLLQLYAKFQMPRLIGKPYWNLLDLNIEKIRSKEAFTLGMLSTFLSGEELKLHQDRFFWAKLSEQRMVPKSENIVWQLNMGGSTFGEQAQLGNIIYDRSSRILWRADALDIPHRQIMIEILRRDYPGWYVGNSDWHRELAYALSGNGKNYLEGLQNAGFRLHNSCTVIHTDWKGHDFDPGEGGGIQTWFFAAEGPWRLTEEHARFFYNKYAIACGQQLYHVLLAVQLEPGANYKWEKNRPVKW